MAKREKNTVNKHKEKSSRGENHTVEEREDLIAGRNAVTEAIKSDRTIEALYIAKGQTEGSINSIISLAKEKKLVIKEVDRKKLDL